MSVLNMSQMNRPFGAVDVSANLKGAVPKTATQKILVTLAEKGELVQKTYGTSPLSCGASLYRVLNIEEPKFQHKRAEHQSSTFRCQRRVTCHRMSAFRRDGNLALSDPSENIVGSNLHVSTT